MSVPFDISIQERDLRLLVLLLHSRVLTLSHLAVLIFEGSKESAKKRLQKLKAHRLVLERRRKAYEQGVLFLSKKGFELLKERQLVPPECSDIRSFSKRAQISELTLRHELEVMDVKTAFYREIGKHTHLSIAEFSTWPRLYEFSVDDRENLRSVRKIVRPDGFIRLHERDAEGTWEHLFFLEVDRSTEKLATLAERARLYNLHYRNGGMAERFGKSADSYKEFPFRVLIVCKSRERLENVARLLFEMNNPLFTQVLFTEMKEICKMPYGKIWSFSGDFQHVSLEFKTLLGK